MKSAFGNGRWIKLKIDKFMYFRQILFLHMICLLTLACHTEEPAAEQPNMLIILADDLGYSDLGCYGSEIQAPNLDARAENGIRFTQFYNSARCCPSRASLFETLSGNSDPDRVLSFEYQGTAAIRVGDWKLVSRDRNVLTGNNVSQVELSKKTVRK